MASSRRAAVLIGATALVLIAIYCVSWTAVSPTQQGVSDFSASYVGGALLRGGHLADLYSDASQAVVHATLVSGGTPGNLAFVNPPPAALLMVPVSLLPFQVAYRLWQTVQLLCLCGATFVALRAAPWSPLARRAGAPIAAALAAFAGTGTLAVGLLGQWDGMSALGLAGAYALWRRDRRLEGAATLAATAAFAKPHLALGLAALMLGWRDRRVLLGAAGGAAAVALASLAIVGPAGLAGCVQAVAADASRWPLASLLGFTGLLGSWLGDGTATQVVALLFSVAACAVCIGIGNKLRHQASLEVSLAAATVLSLVASPHLLAHDLVLLAPMLVALLGWASVHDARSSWPGATTARVLGGWAVLCLAAAADLGSQAPAPPGRIVPLVLIAVALALAWPLWSHRATVARRATTW